MDIVEVDSKYHSKMGTNKDNIDSYNQFMILTPQVDIQVENQHISAMLHNRDYHSNNSMSGNAKGMATMLQQQQQQFIQINQTPQEQQQEAAGMDSSHPQQPFYRQTFQQSPVYVLNSINSIVLNRGKIYNLLQRATKKRSRKCGCVKSYCEAKYCQCYRNGQICGQQCACKDCRNTKPNKNLTLGIITSVASSNFGGNLGCKCKKSGCLKKYCQCYQNGRKCGTHCQCNNCCNCQ